MRWAETLAVSRVGTWAVAVTVVAVATCRSSPGADRRSSPGPQGVARFDPRMHEGGQGGGMAPDGPQSQQPTGAGVVNGVVRKKEVNPYGDQKASMPSDYRGFNEKYGGPRLSMDMPSQDQLAAEKRSNMEQYERENGLAPGTLAQQEQQFFETDRARQAKAIEWYKQQPVYAVPQSGPMNQPTGSGSAQAAGGYNRQPMSAWQTQQVPPEGMTWNILGGGGGQGGSPDLRAMLGIGGGAQMGDGSARNTGYGYEGTPNGLSMMPRRSPVDMMPNGLDQRQLRPQGGGMAK